MKKLDYIIVAGLALAALVLYGVSCADFAFPGESARLLCIWQGLETVTCTPYPLMSAFARMLGGGNAIAPLCGVLSVAMMYLLSVRFLRGQMNGENVSNFRGTASRLAGVTASLVFMLTPAVRHAATHAEPRLFQACWMMASLLVLGWRPRGTWLKLAAWLVFAVMWGAGMADSFLFLVMVPVVAGAIWFKHPKHRQKAGWEMATFLLVGLVAFFVTAANSGSVPGTLDFLAKGARSWMAGPVWIWISVLFISTVPFLVSLLSCNVAFNNEPGWMQWIFHIGMSVASILAIATPASAGSLMYDAGVLPVAASAFAAFTSGYLAAYWYVLTRARVRINESRDDKPVALKGRIFGIVTGSVLAGVYVFTLGFNLFTFDGDRGSFADRLAEEIVREMGDKRWLVTDGSLDHHLKLTLRKTGKEGEIRLIALNRDLDKDYLARLQEMVRTEKLGGEKCEEIAMSLDLGVLPFVQDWFAADPAEAAKTAIWGAPDLWYAAEKTPVPEVCFFTLGAKARDEAEIVEARERMLEAVPVKSGWGSMAIRKVKNPVDRLRLEMRRHLGFVANDRGVWLQDKGNPDAAFEVYTGVLERIDCDNICALFNLFEMARQKIPQAVKNQPEYERKLKIVVEDSARRYRLWSLANYYGYIRSPEIFIRLGFTWARSGRPGEALSQIRRAIDFVPTDRKTVLLNMMASLYASEDERAKSRKVYEYVLEKDEYDHDALIGMMRLSLVEGDSEGALKYLEKATELGGHGREWQIELAMVHLMRGELAESKEILRGLTDSDSSDLRAWSLMAAVTMQQSDAEKDAKLKLAFDRELEDTILPQMEKNTTNVNDYYVQTTRAFLLMRKGAEKRREARDAFVVAGKARPDIQATQDLVLGLDISLDDAESAERHAREILSRDRKSPLANYVMGALALRKTEYLQAELYLKRAADHERPVVLAMNDLAETLRRQKRYDEAERYARKAIQTEPRLYVAYETLGAVLMDKGGDLKEAEANVQKACDLSKVDGKEEDVRMLISLARVQILGGNKQAGRLTLRKVDARKSELSDYELGEYEDLKRNAR